MTERDIKRDREMCEKASPPPWAVEQRGCHELGYDIEGPESGMRGMFEREEDAAFCAESRTALPHYIDLCEHQQRMVDVAADEMAYVVCVHQPGYCDLDTKPQMAKCRKCIRDYLNKKAKEVEGK